MPAILKMVGDPNPGTEQELIAGICFERAEISDVVHRVSGAKIAGAAQKRNKHGLLFQGSIWKPAVQSDAPDFDWDDFHAAFCSQLGSVLQLEPEPKPWPDLSEEEVLGLTEQYAAPSGWNTARAW